MTRAAIEAVAGGLKGSSVFFMDRLSRASLTLAAAAAQQGAVVVLEPSAKGDPRLMAEALKLAHVVKYADSRLEGLDGVMERGTAAVLEIQTLGSEGLRYRERIGGSPSAWRRLAAVPASRLTDSCGSGDWCTAGLVSRLAGEGAKGLLGADHDTIEDALRYGQTLAAWNCGFEGARGGMYACEPVEFEAQLAAIGRGAAELPAQIAQREGVITDPSCPACAPLASAAAHASLPI